MIQDLDFNNFFICRVQPSITFLHHVIPSFLEKYPPWLYIWGFLHRAVFSSTVIALDHEVHSCDILHNSSYHGPAHIPRLSPRGQTINKSHITFLVMAFFQWHLLVGINTLHTCWHSAHNIYCQGSSSFQTSIRVFTSFREIFWSNLPDPLDVDFLHHGCIFHDLFHPHIFHSQELLVRVLQS